MGLRNIFRKGIQKVGDIVFPTQYANWLYMPRTKFNYEKEVNGWQSAIIMACVGWVQRTYPEAPLYLRQRMTDGSWEDSHEHELLALLDTPNPYYDGVLLQQATVADYNIEGNAYWIKLRSTGGRVCQLWWMPSSLMEPKWGRSGTSFIDYYEYTVSGKPQRVAVEDVVHFRNGINPDNMRKGRSPLQSLFREAFTDDEAANMTAALLKNTGVPGLMVSPKDKDAIVSPDDAKKTKELIQKLTDSDNRGEPLVMMGPSEIQQFGFSPEQMNLKDLRRIPEERISAVLGVPAIVAGLGAGLDRSTFANMAEARELAYENNIIPTQKAFGSVVRRQLLTDFMDDTKGWQVAHDLREVRVLQEDENQKATRIGQMVQYGFITVADAQQATGMPVDESQHVYLRPLNNVEIPAQPTKIASSNIETKDMDWSDENKSVEWKRIDRQRQSWWMKLEDMVLPIYEKEGKAVQDAIAGSKSLKVSADPLYRMAKKAIEKLKGEWATTIKQADTEIMKEFGMATAIRYGGQFDPFDANAMDWVVEHTAESVKTIQATNLAEVKEVIKAGVSDGRSNATIAKDLRQFYTDRSPYKATRVARTETSAAAGYGQHASAKQSGFVKTKTWMSARDGRVRDSHSFPMDGQKRPLSETYSNGLMYPGDPSGDPAEFINCRCAEIYGT